MSTALETLEPNALVDVVLDTATETLVTSVQDVTGTAVLLEAPVDRSGRLVLPCAGARGLLVWRGDRDLVQASVAVVDASRPPAPRWEVEVTGRPSPCQRRSFARADVELPTVLSGHGSRYAVTAQDVSEGGLRCTASAAGDLSVSDRVGVDLELAGASWSLEADVVRMRSTPNGTVDLGLRFHGLTLPEADRIRAFVFAEQRRVRASRSL